MDNELIVIVYDKNRKVRSIEIFGSEEEAKTYAHKAQSLHLQVEAFSRCCDRKGFVVYRQLLVQVF